MTLITDGGGSTRALTTPTGSIATGQTFDSDAFGNPLDFNPSNSHTSWLFCGDGRYDQATGFTYHLARWTNGLSFTQMDTVSGQLGNPLTLQSYVLDDANPIIGADASGHDDLGDDDGEDDDGSLSDQAFAQVAGAQVEEIAGLSAVNNYVTSNFGSAVAYGQAGFAVGEFAANTLGLDLQAMTAPIGMLAGVALGGAIELASGGLDSVNGLLSELPSAESTGNAEEMEEIIDEVDSAGTATITRYEGSHFSVEVTTAVGSAQLRYLLGVLKGG